MIEYDHRGKGEGKWGEKGQFWATSYVWIEAFLEEALGLVQVKARLYVNLLAFRKYDFLDSFLFCFVFKIFAVTLLNIIH